MEGVLTIRVKLPCSCETEFRLYPESYVWSNDSTTRTEQCGDLHCEYEYSKVRAIAQNSLEDAAKVIGMSKPVRTSPFPPGVDKTP